MDVSAVQLVDLEQTPAAIVTLPGVTASQLLAAQFSDDQSLLAVTTAASRLHVFDTASGRSMRELSFDADQLQMASIAIARDNSKIAVGVTTGMVRVWDLTNGAELTTPTSWGRSKLVAFSPDSRELATLAGNIFNLDMGGVRNLDNGANVASSAMQSSSSGSLAYLADGSRLMFADGESISIRACVHRP